MTEEDLVFTQGFAVDDEVEGEANPILQCEEIEIFGS